MKLVGLGLVGVILIAFVIRLAASVLSPWLPANRMAYGGIGLMGSAAPSMAPMPYDKATMADSYAATGMPELSARNVAMPMPPTAPGGTTGNDAENFEVTTYNGNIQTSSLKETCGKITALKARAEVIFENASESDRYCNYVFKVERSHVAEVLAYIKELDPKDLTENTQTIKRQVDDFTSEVQILTKKKETIEKTLDDATRAYDEITSVATRSQDANSLANIITSKLQIIERLTQERINISEQLDRLSRAKAEQLDRLEYTSFSINVYKDSYIDGEQLKDSWKDAVKNVVYQINQTIQDVSINLVAVLFMAVQYVLYFFIVLIIVKYVWQAAKYIWRK